MIVKMNKYAFMVYHKEYDAFLERLRSLGVVHVNKTKPTQEHPVMQQLKVEDKRVKTQLDFLQNLLPPEPERAATSELSRQESEILLNKI
jgi:V/A-type H+-transporting ATPase subunit I